MTGPIVCRSAAEFAAHLTAARKARGLSRADLAFVIGVAQTVVWRWENRRVVPQLDSAVRWAAGLGYDLALIPRPAAAVVDVHLPDEDVIP